MCVLSLPQWRCYRNSESLIWHTKVHTECGRSWWTFLEWFWLRWLRPHTVYWHNARLVYFSYQMATRLYSIQTQVLWKYQTVMIIEKEIFLCHFRWTGTDVDSQWCHKIFGVQVCQRQFCVQTGEQNSEGPCWWERSSCFQPNGNLWKAKIQKVADLHHWLWSRKPKDLSWYVIHTQPSH